MFDFSTGARHLLKALGRVARRQSAFVEGPPNILRAGAIF
ncbi:hypothetical protein OP10G_4713 [Fimbriimonas ginsengisoli Gsoil 348]|uniref:Uncharacterized protein n=1 Tax=Fimbriimonas ginsengisoli Gsoil 348 TaxID=661478 RepID=A0A068NXE4_FIMGI|nr:hypothetical protein OP10G_4713 [Fimbriimonas ginsengisoli Gsoil 348]